MSPSILYIFNDILEGRKLDSNKFKDFQRFEATAVVFVVVDWKRELFLTISDSHRVSISLLTLSKNVHIDIWYCWLEDRFSEPSSS